MFIEPILFSLAQHTKRLFGYLPLPIKPKGLRLCVRRSLQDVLHDNRLRSWNVFWGLLWNSPILDSLLHSRGPSNGLIIIFDMRNVGLRHLLRPKIDSLKTYFTFLHDALPAKLSAMHIVNCVSFFDMVMSLIRPCMKNEVVEKVCFTAATIDTRISRSFLLTDKLTSRQQLQETPRGCSSIRSAFRFRRRVGIYREIASQALQGTRETPKLLHRRRKRGNTQKMSLFQTYDYFRTAYCCTIVR